MKRIIPICLCFIFITCTGTENNLNPVTPDVKDISWTSGGLDSSEVLSVIFLSYNYALAGTNYGLYRSSDNGRSWNYVDQDVSKGIISCFCIRSDGNVLAGTTSKGIFISEDNGETWGYIGLQGVLIASLAANSKDIIFAGTKGEGIYMSDSSYEEWTKLIPGADYNQFSSLLINADDIIFAGSSGVYRSDDNGKTWSLKNNGMGNWQVYSLIYDKNGFLDAGTDLGGFFRSEDNGETWTKLNAGLTNTEITTLAINEVGYIFAGTWRGGVYRSIDSGENWAVIDSGLTNKHVFTLAVSPDDFLFAGTPRGIYRTVSRSSIILE